MSRVAALPLALALAFAGCSSVPPNTLVNGWSVGEVKACNDAHCAAQIPVAQAALDEHHPAHAPIVKLTIHEEGGYVNPDGSLILSVRSGGCCDVALFQLADGSIVAFGVGYPGVSEEPIAIVAPPHPDPAQ